MIERQPDTAIDGVIWVCPDCFGPADLVRGDYEWRCDVTERDIAWHEVYGFTVKYWALMAIRAGGGTGH